MSPANWKHRDLIPSCCRHRFPEPSPPIFPAGQVTEGWRARKRQAGLRPGLTSGNKVGRKENEATQGISFCETLSGAPLLEGPWPKWGTESKVTPS